MSFADSENLQELIRNQKHSMILKMLRPKDSSSPLAIKVLAVAYIQTGDFKSALDVIRDSEGCDFEQMYCKMALEPLANHFDHVAANPGISASQKLTLMCLHAQQVPLFYIALPRQ